MRAQLEQGRADPHLPDSVGQTPRAAAPGPPHRALRTMPRGATESPPWIRGLEQLPNKTRPTNEIRDLRPQDQTKPKFAYFQCPTGQILGGNGAVRDVYYGDSSGNSGDFTENFQAPSVRHAGAEHVRGACGGHRAGIAERPETSMTASARRRETLSGPNAHGRTSAGCTGSQSRLVQPSGGATHQPGLVGRPPQGPAGDLTHAMVQLDESAIAGNVGRDLAFAASRLAARSHPGVGGCAAPSSLVIFGISQPNARSTEG